MKMQKKLKVVLAILTTILVSLVSFGGIFYKSKNEMKNVIPSYNKGADLKGYRQIVLQPKDEEQETTDLNSEQGDDENDSEEANEEGNDSIQNQEKVDNRDNYKKSAQIFKDRLKTLKVDNYSVAYDQETGKIEINLPENEQTDIILSDLTQKGRFAIKDSKTEEDLLTNSDVRSVKVGRTNNQSGTLTTYMNIYFTTKGTNKFANVTMNYQNNIEENITSEDNDNSAQEEQNSETNEGETEENISELEAENEEAEENTENTENEEEKTGNQITLNIDDVNMMTTSFDEIIDNGVLSLSLGASENATEEELYSAYNLAAIIENEPLPIEYEVKGNVYISSIFEDNQVKAVVYIEIGIALAVILILSIKFRIKGLIAGLMSVGYVAILLIVARYANVTMSILGIFAVEISFILNSIYSFIKLQKLGDENLTVKEENRIRKEILKDYILVIIPPLIIAIVCLFTQWIQLLSLGMILFWGIIISVVYNYILDKIMD